MQARKAGDPGSCEPGSPPHHGPPGDRFPTPEIRRRRRRSPLVRGSTRAPGASAPDVEGLLEVLVRRAVVAPRPRVALTRRALAGVGTAFANEPAEPGAVRQSLQIGLCEPDVAVDHLPDTQLVADRELCSHLAEQPARGSGEVAAVCDEPTNGLLAGVEDELLVPAPSRIMLGLYNRRSDLSIDRTTELVHISLPLRIRSVEPPRVIRAPVPWRQASVCQPDVKMQGRSVKAVLTDRRT